MAVPGHSLAPTATSTLEKPSAGLLHKLDVSKKEATWLQSIQKRKTSSSSISPLEGLGLVVMLLVQREPGFGLMGQHGIIKIGTLGNPIIIILALMVMMVKNV